MKSVCKLFLVVMLFTSVVFAEGNMGNGDRSCPSGQTTCLVGGQTTEPDVKSSDEEDSILTIVQKYLDSIFDVF